MSRGKVKKMARATKPEPSFESKFNGFIRPPPRRKRLNETDPRQDRHDGLDPQIEEWRFVLLGVDPPDPASNYDEAAEGPEPDRDVLNALRACMRNALSKQEHYVLLRRLAGDTYAAIARAARPRLRDASHAGEIERRALAKLRTRLKNYNYRG
jgi:hypothetical protein